MLRRLRIENLVLIREADLELASGLNAVTGETGAGKTIFAQAIGLLLGARADVSVVGADGDEAYVEAELDLPDWLLDDAGFETLAELRPEGEEGLVAARRVFADGRTRAYAWGRAVARDDLAAVVERLVAMSGQFEQRRLARPSYRIDVLDGACGSEQAERRVAARLAWRALEEARVRLDDVSRDGAARQARLDGLAALVSDTAALEAGEEDGLRADRDRLRHVGELGAGVVAALAAIDGGDGPGAAALATSAERAIAPLEVHAKELGPVAAELRDLALRLGEAGSDLARLAASLEDDPARLDAIEERLQLWADLRRRHGCATSEELLARRDDAVLELDREGDGDPLDAAHRARDEAQSRMDAIAAELHAARTEAAPAFAAAVTSELQGLGLGEGEFVVELAARDCGPTGLDEVVFLVRPNAGLPLAPVAETASGGELSRIALAIAAVGGGETMVFDEIDAGIGGVTAHAVAATLQRLGERAQVLTITHLPQIASVAGAHFRVEKVEGDPTHTRVTRLDEAERRGELERMLGGEEFLAAVARGADTT